MSDYRRAKVQGGVYFFTVITYDRQAVLLEEAVRAALRQGIENARRTLPFEIEAWVLLPDHLHCLWTLPPEDHNFSARWAIIKRQVSRDCSLPHQPMLSQSRQRRNESGFWQRRFWEHLIRDETDFRHHMDYIHWNPVKHGYVKQVADWPYSTFHRHVRRGWYPPDWGGAGVDAMKGEFGE
jgi:putative transposase